MSKVGKEPIKFDSSKITITKEDKGIYGNGIIKVSGPKGDLELPVRPGVSIEINDGEVVVTRKNEQKQNKAYHGLYRSLINNMVAGVTDGFEKKLEIHGVGYRGSVAGGTLQLNVGFSHQIDYAIPEDVQINMPDENTIIITGIDKQRVGQVTAEIRELRKPEPYKGKGIRYEGEQVRRKAGKSAASAS